MKKNVEKYVKLYIKYALKKINKQFKIRKH